MRGSVNRDALKRLPCAVLCTCKMGNRCHHALKSELEMHCN